MPDCGIHHLKPKPAIFIKNALMDLADLVDLDKDDDG
jgi:hypothetical protein